MDYDLFFQVLINGLTLGAIYGLIAIGYTMVYGILGMINFAHGDVFMIGSFISLIAFMLIALFIPVILPISLAIMIVLIVSILFTSVWSFAIERIAYRPLRNSFRLAPLITAIGVSIALQNFVQIQQGPRNKSLPEILTGGFYVPGTMIQIQYKQILVIAVTMILLAIFSYLVSKTSLGRAQRACAQDRKMAALLGINVNYVITATFVIGAALAAIAGTIYFIYYGQVNFYDGFIPGIKAFTAAVLGGIGSLPGAVLGGIIIALVESFWSAYLSPDYKDVAAFALLALILIFMPSGLLGRPEVEKV